MAVLMREAIGGTLRRARTARRRTLRDVSRRARVSLGYLSEIERGRKEPSSELLAAICEALDVALPDLLTEAAGAIAESLADSLADSVTSSVRTRPIGLRHMDLRLASDAPRATEPLSAPVPALPLVPAGTRPRVPAVPLGPAAAPVGSRPAGTVRAAA